MCRAKRPDRQLYCEFPAGIVMHPIRTVPRLGNVYPARTAGAARREPASRSRRTSREAWNNLQPHTGKELARSLRSLARPNTNALRSRSTEIPVDALAALPDTRVQPCVRSYLRSWFT